MTDDRKEGEGPYDFEKMFGDSGHAEATASAARPTGKAAATGPAEETNGHGQQDDAIAERCRRMAQEVQSELPVSAFNLLRPCKGEQEFPGCKPLQLPEIRPRVYVFWGAAPCDCIEGDDTEIMTILVYNPYSNVTLECLTINRIVVVDSNGNPVPNLPDGSPAIQLVPRGPHCFGSIAPCRFAYRQFVLRLRGAPPGAYRILIQGICFKVCLHRMTEECVTFNVCRD